MNNPKGNSREAAASGNRRKLILRTGAKSSEFRRKSAGIRVKGIIGKMLGGSNPETKSKSCDDLYVL